MSPITDDPAAELHELRRRAYGPGADIHDDAAAVARLHELENGTRVASAPVPPAVAPAPITEKAPDLPAPVRADQTDAPVEPTVDDEASGSGIPSPPVEAETPAALPPPVARVPWWRRRMRLLWAGSLVVAALIGAGVALSVQSVGEGQTAVLAEDPEGEWPQDFWNPPPPGSRIFEEYYGFAIVTVPEDYGYGAVTCMYLLNTTATYFGASGCGAGPFPATASVVVSSQAPEEARTRFGLGSALKFVLDGDRVRVYAAQPSPAETR